MDKLSLYGLIGAIALTTAACGSSEQAETTDSTMPTGSAGGVAEASPAPSAAGPKTAMRAQAFVDAAGASDMFEIESSKLAQTMAQSPDEKSFAAMMIADHTKSSAELKAAAAKASPAVTVAPKLTAQQQADLDALRNAGDKFDDVYAQKQVAAHQQALTMLQDYAANGEAASLKAFATKTAPVVSGHLKMARDLP